jgi:hypothetical protein
VTILAVLYANWREVTMPDLKLLFALTGVLTVASGLHYLITSRRYLESE